MNHDSSPDPGLMNAIERELARTDLRLNFRDGVLEARYGAQRQERSRFHNRVTIPGLVIIFDLFLLTEFRAAPEIVALSTVMRGAMTLAACLFVLLDWRGLLGRLTGPAVVSLAILPTVFASIETMFTHSLTALPNLEAIPLIQLGMLIWRMSVRQAGIAATASCIIFGGALLTAPYVPPAIIPSLALTDLAIGIAVFTFAIRLDFRDRQVFLLSLQASIRGDMLEEQNCMLARLSQIDALTGLGNRRCFDAALADAWADADARHAAVALIMVDIDHFKAFNDSFGHTQGDHCLRAVSNAAAGCVRSGADTLARYGGEEFALILRGTTLEEARGIAERLREAVLACAIPHQCMGPPGVVTISLGVASMVPGNSAAAELVEAADQCLYAAKRRGRNRVETKPAPAAPATPYIKLVAPPDISNAREAS